MRAIYLSCFLLLTGVESRAADPACNLNERSYPGLKRVSPPPNAQHLVELAKAEPSHQWQGFGFKSHWYTFGEGGLLICRMPLIGGSVCDTRVFLFTASGDKWEVTPPAIPVCGG